MRNEIVNSTLCHHFSTENRQIRQQMTHNFRYNKKKWREIYVGHLNQLTCNSKLDEEPLFRGVDRNKQAHCMVWMCHKKTSICWN